MHRIACFLFVTGILVTAFQSTQEPKGNDKAPEQGEQAMAITVSSSVFEEGGMIPVKYTCDGEDISPPLKFEGIPPEAQSLALIGDDPDAPMGTWVHWVLYNLPPKTEELPEKIPGNEKLENGAIHGVTDFGRFGYGGPCPPSGTHRYFFKIYALDIMLELSGKVDKKTLVKAIEGHILAEGRLMGTYKRQ